ncbi:MAG: hypothetical protein U0401_36160, partial [Anaerolineae bacterium]
MNMISYQQLAQQDFNEAVQKSFWRGLYSLVTRKSNDLLSLEAIPLQGQKYLGLQSVALDRIVGSEGRYHEFDRAFFPRQDHSK